MKYCISDTSHPVLRYCKDNSNCLYASTITLQKVGGKRKKGKKSPENAKPEREEKKCDIIWQSFKGNMTREFGFADRRGGQSCKDWEWVSGKKEKRVTMGRSRVKGWALWVHQRSLSQALLWEQALPSGAGATAATVLWLVLTSAKGYYLGGKKVFDLYFALIIISISVTLLGKHLFIAWIKLYFSVSVLLLLLKPWAQHFRGKFRSFGEICTLCLVGKHPQPLGWTLSLAQLKYFAEQPWQDRLVQGWFHLPVPLHACLAAILQQLGDG